MFWISVGTMLARAREGSRMVLFRYHSPLAGGDQSAESESMNGRFYPLFIGQNEKIAK